MKNIEFCGNGWFDVAATLAVTLKLLYAFNDIDWDRKGVQSLDQTKREQLVKTIKNKVKHHKKAIASSEKSDPNEIKEQKSDSNKSNIESLSIEAISESQDFHSN